MSNFTFKPLSLALFAMLSAGTLSAQNFDWAPKLGPSGEGLQLFQYNGHGDFMGMAGNAINLKHINYYDNTGRLVRRGDYGRDAKDGSYELTKYYYYEYNEKGQLVLSFARQYGLYEDDDLGFDTKAIDSTTYKYNDAGLLEQKIEDYQTTFYTYDAEENLVEEKNTTSDGSVVYDCVYSDFVAKNCPKRVVSTSPAYEAFNYIEEREYNALNQQTRAERYQVAEDVDDNGAPVQKRRELLLETVTYDKDGFKTCMYQQKEKSPWKGLEKGDSIVYERDATNPNVALTHPYEWSNELKPGTTEEYGWQPKLSYDEYIYGKLDTNLSVPVEVSAVEGEINTNKVTFKVNDAMDGGQYTFNVYCDGRLVHVAHLSDAKAYDSATKTYTFVHKRLKNCYHDYFVQAVKANEQPNAISNVVLVTNHVELPSVGHLRVASYRKATAKENTANSWKSGYFANLAWDPVSAEDSVKYELKAYEVYLPNDKMPANREYKNEVTGEIVNAGCTGFEHAWEIGLAGKSASTTIDVQAVYPYGRVHNYIKVVMKELLAGVDEVVADGVSAHYDGTTLQLSKPSQVKVYNAAGAVVKSESNASAVTFDGLAHGAYVVYVVNGGQVSAVKVVR